LRAGWAAIEAEFPERFGRGRAALPVAFEGMPRGAKASLRIERDGAGVRICYRRPTDAFRALGQVLGGERGPWEEAARFDLLGVMLDVSRNAVLAEGALRSLLCRFALMGIHAVLLYAEDTYAVPGEPFFGYLRGGYSAAELRRIDAFARGLGIEVIPCIQTLGHMAQVLQWPAYAGVRDTPSILLAGEEKTYALLGKMLRAASAPFRTRRIHVGMDEAHGLGTGQYKARRGARDPFGIFNAHLARVRGICRGLGLRPMIWSDMYFRLGSRRNDYYDRASVIPARVAARIPRDVQLVYWDYYHHDAAFYREWIRRHRRLGFEPVVAAGVWTWDHFWAALPHSFSALDACMGACKAEGVREAFVTLWGDDGAECDFFSGLPGIQHFAEHGYGAGVDEGRRRRNFRGSCGADFDAWGLASRLDSVPGVRRPGRSATNLSKVLLWQDPFLALGDPHLKGRSLAGHYRALAAALEKAARGSRADARLRFPAALARALEEKAPLRREMARAHARKDRAAALRIARRSLPRLRARVEALRRLHRELWFRDHRPFGWEVLERRYGGLLARLETVGMRLEAWAKGELPSIPELGARLRPCLRVAHGDMPYARHARLSTPSCLA
jgi:hypothetical protein